MGITFITHLRYDTPDRIKNLQTVLAYYQKYLPDSKFIFVEDDKTHNPKFDILSSTKNSAFYFIKNDGWYHRTKAFNYGIKISTTNIIGTLDTDCIVDIDSIKRCCNELKQDVTVAWPYNGLCVNVSYDVHKKFIENIYNYQYLKSILNNNFHPPVLYKCNNYIIAGSKSIGGVVLFNREKIIECGGYNEKFVAWGFEDNEIYTRVKKLGYKDYRDNNEQSILFHFPHPKTIKSNHPYYLNNQVEYKKIFNMPNDQLQKYIKTENFYNE